MYNCTSTLQVNFMCGLYPDCLSSNTHYLYPYCKSHIFSASRVWLRLCARLASASASACNGLSPMEPSSSPLPSRGSCLSIDALLERAHPLLPGGAAGTGALFRRRRGPLVCHRTVPQSFYCTVYTSTQITFYSLQCAAIRVCRRD